MAVGQDHEDCGGELMMARRAARGGRPPRRRSWTRVTRSTLVGALAVSLAIVALLANRAGLAARLGPGEVNAVTAPESAPTNEAAREPAGGATRAQTHAPTLEDPDLPKAEQAEELIAEAPSSPARRGIFARGFVAVFLHVHKSGGTTMCNLACKQERAVRETNCNVLGGPDRIKFSNGSPEDFEAVVDKYHKDKRRHLTFIASEWYLPARLPARPDFVYITMLRNPLARTESHFHMAFDQILRQAKSSAGGLIVRRGRFSEGMPTLKMIRNMDSDMQVASAARQYFALNTPDNWQTRAVCGPACAAIPFGQLADEHFEIARHRLENDFAVVGIIEHFQETISLFHDLLQWRGQSSDFFTEHHGTHHSGLTVLERIEQESAKTPRLLDFARWWHAVNQFDIELYNVGRKVFAKQAAAAGLIVDLGPDISTNYLAPTGEVTSAQDLRAMVRNFTVSESCSTQCCTAKCAPIGRFWLSTAMELGMAPAQR